MRVTFQPTSRPIDMKIDAVYAYCSAKRGVTEEMPFGDDVLVFKVMGKMFALLNLKRLPLSLNLKCAPEKAIVLREQHASVLPGYHMNKKHWNTILLEGDVTPEQIREWIDDSYDLVVRGLKSTARAALAQQ